MRSRKEEPVWLSQWAKPLAIGTVAGIMTCCISMFLLAALLLTQDAPHNFVSPLALVALVAGCFVGGIVTARCAGQNSWLMGLLCGSGLFLLVLLTSGFALFRNTDAQPLLKLAVMLVSAVAGGMVGINLKRKRA